MSSRFLARSMFVLAMLGAMAVTGDAGFLKNRHCSPCSPPCIVAPVDPGLDEAMKQTVTKLVTRIEALHEYVNSTKANIPAEAKAEINQQLLLIGLRGHPEVVGGKAFPNEFTPDQVQDVGGEIGKIRNALKRLKE